MIGIKDVALEAGVSIATVSNVINKRKPVSPELELRVLQAIKSLNYEVNPVGRGLKSAVTNQIGVIVPSFSQVYFPAVLQGIHEAGKKHGYAISVYETGGNVEVEKKYVKYLQGSWTDGILLATYANSENKSEREYIRSLATMGAQKKKIPVVTLENVIGPNIDAVIIDNYKASATAMRHLLDLGHLKIVHIAAPQKFNHGRLRMEGYIKSLEMAGIKPDPNWVSEGDFSPVSGYNCMKELLKKQIEFTAVFAASDQMAIGAMRALLDEGFKVPEDVAIIGIDNNFPSTLVSPSLSSVNLPKFDMGYQAVELLTQRIQEPDKIRSVIVLDSELIVRQSTSSDGDKKWNLMGW